MNKQVDGFIIAHSKAVYLSDMLDRVILHGQNPYLTWAEWENTSLQRRRALILLEA